VVCAAGPKTLNWIVARSSHTLHRHETSLLGLRDREKSAAPNEDGNTSNVDDTDDGVTHEEITYSYSVHWHTRGTHRHSGPAGIQKRSRGRSRTPKRYRDSTAPNTDCLSDILGPIRSRQPAPNTNRNEPQLEQSYEETHMRSTGNVFDAPTSNNPEEPSSNTGQSLACLFNNTHINISPKRFRQHLRICKERIKLTQSMLAPEERVKNTKGTARV
jgi:hypothetical protein